MAVKWKLKETLEAHGVTAYALAEAMGGASRRAQLYAITSPTPDKRPERIGLPLLDDILKGMHQITGKELSISDVLEWSNT